ncbi:MAG TPA: Wzt carbohydrate-binding domain-containing protein [Bryobacteraceae bacterium]|nr:Wzt carbohydrate-binding domain-containing protein [Bryobacteraceae bacterium]
MAIDFRGVHLPPLRGFSAWAPDGAVIGLVGAQNAGISELLRLAAGLVQPVSGAVAAGSGARAYIGLTDKLDFPPVSLLAIDHALAIHDLLERAKAAVALGQLRSAGATVLLASHELQLLQSLCDEVWWLAGGALALRGDPREVLPAYRAHILEQFQSWGERVPPPLRPVARRGDGRAEIVALEMLAADGRPSLVLRSGEPVTARVTVRYREAVAEPVIGIMIRTRVGFEVYGTNTELEKFRIGPRPANDTARVDFSFRCDLCPGDYTVTAASHDPDGTPHDWLEDAIAFVVADLRETAGVANLRAEVSRSG